jgi:two-component system LytT family sensor kinase
MGELLNLVGFSCGVVLYAMLLAMVVRASRAPGGTPGFDPLLLATALLGLVWNLCALPAYELPKVGIEGPFPVLIAVGFSALGFLPAVVVHSVLRGERDDVSGALKRTLAALAYLVSAVAAVLHVEAAWAGEALPSPLGMRLLTYTFVALVVPLAALTRGQPGARRALWAAALATFAVSALHLSRLHQGDVSWPVELVGHHASLPLAFAILYQDYPFAFADLFLKRALALLTLVGLAFLAIALFSLGSTAFSRFVQSDPRQVGMLVTLWVATALLYPVLRSGTTWFVDAVVLHRPDYRSLGATVARRVQAHEDIESLLTDLSVLLTPALNSRAVRWHEWHAGPHATAAPSVSVGSSAIQTFLDANIVSEQPLAATVSAEPLAALVVVPVSEAPHYLLTIATLTGGRRLLSDDLATLEAIALAAARRIDALRFTRERHQRELREQEMTKLAAEAELRALRAQINPHFLFNALTTIGYLIQTAPPRALDTLMRLTSLLRAVLRSEGEYTTLGRELDVIEAYLEIEQARFEERLRVHIDVPLPLRTIRVPPLLLQPIVENAVKHGIGPRQRGGEVTVRARLEGGATDAPKLRLTVHDTGVGATNAAFQRGQLQGVGLRNIERRLANQYGAPASLSVRTAPGDGTTVEILLPIAAESLSRSDAVGS